MTARTGSARAYTVMTMFSGLGGGALGFQRAGFRVLAGVDYDAAACADYERLVGSPCHQGDLGTMTPAELRRVCPEPPDVLFTSPPCQAFSGCLPAVTSLEPRYQDMSALSARGLALVLEAWPERPPRLVLLENVPRIQTRGRAWLDEIVHMLARHGYAIRETTHDCGELGGLAQSRPRFLLVARHMASVPEVLYVPPQRRIRSVGEVLADLPIPGEGGGPLHRLPGLSALNWLRLACIPAGGDWRDLPDHVELTCTPRNGAYGVAGWDDASDCVVGAGQVDNGRWAVADPQSACVRREGSLGVTAWDRPTHPIIGASSPHNTGLQVADPRLTHVPRPNAYRLTGWDEPHGVVIGTATPQHAASAVSDPRAAYTHELTGTYRRRDVTVTRGGEAQTYRRRRVLEGATLHGPAVELTARGRLVIQAPDGTWHRPLTTLELAVLQGLPSQVDGEWLQLDGRSDRAWRQRVGNAVPPPTAEAIARSMLATLRASDEGRFLLSSTPRWVAPEVHP